MMIRRINSNSKCCKRNKFDLVVVLVYYKRIKLDCQGKEGLTKVKQAGNLMAVQTEIQPYENSPLGERKDLGSNITILWYFKSYVKLEYKRI